jgi:hypothetical protein
MRDSKDKLQSRVVKFSYLVVCSILVLVGIAVANGQTQIANKANITKFHSVEVQQPIYREYRGVRLNMTIEEARAKLGAAQFRSDDLDYYIFSTSESAQIAYKANKVVTISVDFTAGVGAPDYKTVVGTGLLLERTDGSSYRMVEYDAEGFWVSYNKSAGTVPVITITLQVSLK